MLVFMLLTCFFGFLMKKIWISVLGVLIGFTLGALIAVLINQGAALIIIFGLVLAIIEGVIAFKLYRVGMFIWTGSLVFSMVYDFLARFLDIREMAPAALFALLGIGVLLAALGMAVQFHNKKHN